jgi:ATP phosphoribosyltransferase regulatory subunit
MQEGRPDPMRPREFRQAGIEYFGGDAAAADAEVITLTLEAVRAAGCADFVLRLGHTGMFSALLTALPMPERWRGRLKRAFWRPRAFARELRHLVNGPRNGEDALLARIVALAGDTDITEPAVLDYLDRENIALIGLRRPSEIAAILNERAADAKERPLSPDVARTIEAYLAVRGALPQALHDIRALGADVSRALAKPLDTLAGIHRAVEQAGLGENRVAFAADFGRQIEYYTGFVFQIEIPGAGIAGQIAGGGRYDAMLRAISGGAVDMPAVGAAIHTERPLAAAGSAR